MKYIILSFPTIIITAAVYFFFYLGFLKDPINLGIVEEQFYTIGSKHVGPYFKIHEIISDVETWAKANNIHCSLTFGLYIDDPNISDDNRLRSEGGCLSNNTHYNNTKNLSSKYFVKTITKRKYLKLEFSGSPAISPFKVYPEADDWFRKTNYQQDKTVLEVYKISGRSIKTYYYFPIKE